MEVNNIVEVNDLVLIAGLMLGGIILFWLFQWYLRLRMAKEGVDVGISIVKRMKFW